MNPTLDRRSEALKDRYRIEREPGAGGMATVYDNAELRPASRRLGELYERKVEEQVRSTIMVGL